MTQEQFVDYGNATEVYVDGWERIETLGANVCWVGYRYQADPDEPGMFLKVIALKVITPINAVPQIMNQIIEIFGAHIAQRRNLGNHQKNVRLRGH